MLHPLSLSSAELLSLRGGIKLPTILTPGWITGDRASQCQPTLLLLSLDKGEQHWVWLPGCSHTHALTHLCMYGYVCVYIYTQAFTVPIYTRPYHTCCHTPHHLPPLITTLYTTRFTSIHHSLTQSSSILQPLTSCFTFHPVPLGYQ